MPRDITIEDEWDDDTSHRLRMHEPVTPPKKTTPAERAFLLVRRVRAALGPEPEDVTRVVVHARDLERLLAIAEAIE